MPLQHSHIPLLSGLGALDLLQLRLPTAAVRLYLALLHLVAAVVALLPTLAQPAALVVAVPGGLGQAGAD